MAGKSSRNGSDGGWLRRCTLTSTLVSVVNDEDTYQDTDRRMFLKIMGLSRSKKSPLLKNVLLTIFPVLALEMTGQ